MRGSPNKTLGNLSSVVNMIPPTVTILHGKLPDVPGVYFHYGEDGTLLYIGKATSLKKRVGSYFTKAHDARIEDLVSKIRRIDYLETPTVIEALVLEANQIKKHRPPYNILLRDDKTFLYLVMTNEEFPRPELIRGHDLEKIGINPFDSTLSEKAKRKYLAVFGPYPNGFALKKALEIIRRAIPWSTCTPPVPGKAARACFNAQIGQCPGVCAGRISKADYRKTIRNLIRFFEGKKSVVVREMKREMKQAATEMRYEVAAQLRNQIDSLEHIHDVALIMREEPLLYLKGASGVDLNGRIEAYDISNISGTSAVGSMVVFEQGKPAKQLYRKFRIKTVEGSNDFAMMEEVLRRRLKRGMEQPGAWPLPELMVIDGGEGQMGKVYDVMRELGVSVPIVGLAKGFDRKQDRLVFDRGDEALAKAASAGKELFQRARDEAHRFAVAYHRVLRKKTFLPTSSKRA